MWNNNIKTRKRRHETTWNGRDYHIAFSHEHNAIPVKLPRLLLDWKFSLSTVKSLEKRTVQGRHGPVKPTQKSIPEKMIWICGVYCHQTNTTLLNLSYNRVKLFFPTLLFSFCWHYSGCCHFDDDRSVYTKPGDTLEKYVAKNCWKFNVPATFFLTPSKWFPACSLCLIPTAHVVWAWAESHLCYRGWWVSGVFAASHSHQLTRHSVDDAAWPVPDAKTSTKQLCPLSVPWSDSGSVVLWSQWCDERKWSEKVHHTVDRKKSE